MAESGQGGETSSSTGVAGIFRSILPSAQQLGLMPGPARPLVWNAAITGGVLAVAVIAHAALAVIMLIASAYVISGAALAWGYVLTIQVEAARLIRENRGS